MTNTPAQRLAEAEDALHRLIIGQQPVEVRNGDTAVRYAPGQEAALRRYIAELKVESGQTSGRRAIRVAFR